MTRRQKKARAVPITLRDVQQPHAQFDADFRAVYTALREQIGGTHNVTETSLVPLLMAAIRVVERMAREPGEQKKQLVLALITTIIEESSASETAKIAMQQVLETVGPSIIDGLIDADHGKLLARGWAKLRESCTCAK